MNGYVYCRGPGPDGHGCTTLLWVPRGKDPYCPACQTLMASAPPKAEAVQQQ